MSFFRNLLSSLTIILTGLAVGSGPAAAPIPDPPKVAASGYILLDFNSGRILAEKNSHERLEPASITKIMTAYVVLNELKQGNIHLSDEVVISENAWRMPGSRTFVEAGATVDVETLFNGMVIQSGNDASVALAEHVAGSEDAFAGLMNEQARRLGMEKTHFVNSTGLPSQDHLTTAHDISLMATATIRDFPDHYPTYAIKEFTYNNIKQYNRNRLLWRDKSVDGIKTGHTENAGYCLATSAKRGDMRLIGVVMGTKSDQSRTEVSQALLNYGFRFFETHQLYRAGNSLNTVRIWQGDQQQLDLGLKQDLYVTIPRNQYNKLKAEMVLDSTINAPINKGQELGKVIITLEGDTISEVPLVALQDVAKGGIWSRIKDSVLRWFE